MYIRRKVFSKFQDEAGEERYYSTTEYTIEQDRYFSKCDDDTEEDKPKRKKNLGKKVAIGTGIAAGSTLAGIGGYQLLKKYKNINSDGGGYLMNGIDRFGWNLQDKVKDNVDKVKKHLKRKK